MGVKKIGIFDDYTVSEKDAYNSIYFDKDSIGKDTRANACKCKLENLTIFTEIITVSSNDH